MPANDLLEVYLNDHLAGSAAAVDLVEKLAGRNPGTPLAGLLADLGSQIEADKATLERVIQRLDVATSSVKQLGAKALEKLSRLRVNDRVTGSADVSRLMEIEMLSLGIEGKMALWLVLQDLAPSAPALSEFDWEGLIGRARQQRADLEPFRLAAALSAFAAADDQT